MRYTRFEDFPVWNNAIELAVAVYSLTIAPVSDAAVASEIKLSVPRFPFRIISPKVLNAALTMSSCPSFTSRAARQAKCVRCSACSNDCLLSGACGRDSEPLKSKAESCSRQLKAWAKSLQDSDFKGERHVNAKMKRAAQAAKEREEFLNELAEIRAKAKAATSKND